MTAFRQTDTNSDIQIPMSRMLTFHVSLHARPESVTISQTPLAIAGQTFRALQVSPEALAAPFAITFEEAGQALERLPRLFFEPDGSFVWTSESGEPKWQVDGNLFDRSGRLLFVDLKGSCPSKALDQLLQSFGWPQTPVMF